MPLGRIPTFPPPLQTKLFSPSLSHPCVLSRVSLAQSKRARLSTVARRVPWTTRVITRVVILVSQSRVSCQNVNTSIIIFPSERVFSAIPRQSFSVRVTIFFVFLPPSPLKNGDGGILYSDLSVTERACASWKPCEHHISKTNEGNFTQFWSQMYLGSQMCWLAFGVKKSRSQQAMTRCKHHISKTNEGNFAQFWSQMYLGS